MRFEFYHDGLAGVPKLSVDGTVGNAAHLSHWEGNATPEELRADTSTEIALNFVASPRRAELTEGVEVVTNNHFDTDGVLSVWTVLNGGRALGLREELVAAAAAGGLPEIPKERAAQASMKDALTNSSCPKSSACSRARTSTSRCGANRGRRSRAGSKASRADV